jgi:heme oxygenase
MMDTTTASSNSSSNKNKNKTETQCPYAVALHHHNDDSSVHTDDTTSAADPDLDDIGENNNNNNNDASRHSSGGSGGFGFSMADVKDCPAFETGSCPFKKPEEMQETLQKIPPSHFDPQGKFFQIIQELHLVHGKIQENLHAQDKDGSAGAANTATNGHAHAHTVGGSNNGNGNNVSNYLLPGGCPVQATVKRASGSSKDETTVAHVSFSEAMESWSLAAIMARLAKEQGIEMDIDMEDEPSDHPPEESVVTPTVVAEAAAEAPPTFTEDRPSLAQALKAGTAVSHQAAEDVHFVRNFIQGKIDRQIYGKMVGMLYHVYVKLEHCLDQAGPQHFSTLHFPLQLSRHEALEEDLDFWHGSHVKKDAALNFVTPAVQDYMDRLDYLLEHDPILLLAHSYTRYLGDLSGGKILARVARRALDLQEDGLAFYEFAHVPSAKRFKDRYRQAMDGMPLTAHQVVKLVGEANVAFLLNMRLFEELDVMANVPGATVRPLAEVLAYADGGALGRVDAKAAAEAECPFMVGKKDKAAAAAAAAATAAVAAATTDKGATTAGATAKKRCPWPFILAHDPVDALQDWQTWAVVGLLMCWTWSRFVVAGTVR